MDQLGKTVLITGAARRVGAGIARGLHARGASVMLHYRGAEDAARTLAAELNRQRAGSAVTVHADLLDIPALPALIEATLSAFGRLDGLVNNASSFFPTPIGQIDEAAWDDLIGSNLKAPLFLAQAAAPALTASRGALVGLIDIHVDRPMTAHAVYTAAKAGHAATLRALARDLAPHVRVNGVSPGVNLWPEGDSVFDQDERRRIEATIPLARIGTPDDIARAVGFLLFDASYVTGQILAVDGGRSVVL